MASVLAAFDPSDDPSPLFANLMVLSYSKEDLTQSNEEGDDESEQTERDSKAEDSLLDEDTEGQGVYDDESSSFQDPDRSKADSTCPGDESDGNSTRSQAKSEDSEDLTSARAQFPMCVEECRRADADIWRTLLAIEKQCLAKKSKLKNTENTRGAIISSGVQNLLFSCNTNLKALVRPASIVSQVGDTNSPSEPDLVIVREVLQPLVVFEYSVKGSFSSKRAQAFQYSSVFQQHDGLSESQRWQPILAITI